MHIPDNYLSPETCAAMTCAVIPCWIHSVKKVKKEITKEKMPLLGVCAAFAFVGMMFNIPLPGGTTGHAVGGTLIAILLGPAAACISITIALLIQALLFGDGGILAFGANCFNIAFILPYVGYGVYQLINRLTRADTEGGFLLSDKESINIKPNYVSAACGAYAGINAAALLTAIEFGIQPLLFHSESGSALYCPYGLEISVPAMMAGHLTIFGAAEVVFTVAVLIFAYRFFSKGSCEQKDGFKKYVPFVVLLGILCLLVPLGLLAAGTAWGEWELSEIGISEMFSFSSLFPDYSVGDLPPALGYILSAVTGSALLIILFRLISSGMKTKTKF